MTEGKRATLWLVLLAAAGTFALTMGTRQTMGLFLSPLNTATGLGLASISLAFAFGQLWWGLTQPFAGAMADKIGAGRVLFIGALLVAVGTFVTPYMTSTWGLILAIGVLSAGGAGMAGPAVLMAATTRLVPPERRGFATGIVNAGGSFGQFALAPIAATLMVSLGWVSAMQVIALLVLLCLPAAFVLRGHTRCVSQPQLSAAGRRFLHLWLSRRVPGHAPAGCGRLVRSAHRMGRLVAGLAGPLQHRRQRDHGLGHGPLAHEVAAVAGVRHARAGGAGVPAGTQDRPRRTGLLRGDGTHLPVGHPTHRRPGGQVLRAGQHGHAVRHRDAHAPGRRLSGGLAGRQGVRGHRLVRLDLVRRHAAGLGRCAGAPADPRRAGAPFERPIA
jgi:hypothetical protein